MAASAPALDRTNDPLTWDDYLRALVYRAYDLKDGPYPEYRAALEDVAAAPGRWPLVRWNVAITLAHERHQEARRERERQFTDFMLDTADWLASKGLT